MMKRFKWTLTIFVVLLIGCGAPVFVSSDRAVAGWMPSSHNRENILNPKFTEIGVGYIQMEGSPYRWYWTADFAAP
jgi:uncharacterized protein YkwD